ncbi:MAG: Eco57I restriction-modification methylase domain-containing protein, partial [Candidatus Heimdallarchaeaceae archaeon]
LGPENLTLGEIETKEVKKLKKKVQELEKIKDTSPEDHFEWRLNFNEVFDEKGGFDVVIGNPPWEKVKPQDPEFFRLYEPEYRKKSKQVQKEIKDKFLQDKQVKREYEKFLNIRYKIMKFASSNYKLQGSSDLNYYKLFVEKSLDISKLVICWLIPGSITIDKGSAKLRKYLIDQKRLNEIIGFSNKEGLFEWIDNNQKFIILSLLSETTEKISIFGWLSNAKNLENLSKIKIKQSFYQELDPENITFYLDRSNTSFDILQKFLADKKIHPLREIGFQYWAEYHATNDSSYFNDSHGKYMLFSGKVIDQFDCMAKSWIEDHGRSSKWKRMSFPKSKKDFRTEYFVSEIPDRIIHHHNQNQSNFRIVIQNVTGTINNVRTVYACALHKKHLTNNSLHNLYIGDTDEELFYYLGILNSFVLDWQARIKVATNLNKFILESFLLPNYKQANPRLRKRLADLSFFLSNVCTDFGDANYHYRVNKNYNREIALGELNAISARLYSLNETEFRFILSYFSLVEPQFKKITLKFFKELTNES